MTCLRRTLVSRCARLVHRIFHVVCSHLLPCSSPGGNGRYRQVKASFSTPDLAQVSAGLAAVRTVTEADYDTLSLKITILILRYKYRIKQDQRAERPRMEASAFLPTFGGGHPNANLQPCVRISYIFFCARLIVFIPCSSPGGNGRYRQVKASFSTPDLAQVNVPKTKKTFCKNKACRKHTLHKVTQYKKGKDSLSVQGKRRYDRKQSGYGGQTKPVFHKKAKTTKKIVLKLQCQSCKHYSQHPIKRCKHFEIGGDKKGKGTSLF
ncbi:hypothetical protein C4D60_Mb09t21380 [Musa balbisiana]|uniref:60S ribosomal protein L44 n=1 Tax=Musa balbisiana TaxID=52838 RepID=A0A4S8IIS3_MUSBA|nr:hypothetical protein C4D60_Mb09t21380 [Musa balbisiana]